MTRTLAPNKKNKALLKSLGVELSDSNGKYREYVDILRDLDKALAGYTEEQKNTFLVQLAGRENQRALNILLKNSGERYNELSKDVMDYAGAAAEAARIQEDNVLGILKSVQSAWSETMIEMSADNELTGVVREVADSVKEELPSIANFGKTMIKGFAGLTKFVIKNKDIIIPVFSGLTASVVALGVAITVMGGIAIATAVGITAPIMGVVGAIGTGVAAGIALVRNWESIAEFGSLFFDDLKDKARSFGQFFVDLGLGIVNVVFYMVNGTIDLLNQISFDMPEWVPKVGGKHFGVDIGKLDYLSYEIPQFATGTMNTPDTFIAGEEGPELITNAPNRRVFTANETTDILGGGKSITIQPGAIQINVQGGDEDLASKVRDEIEDFFGTLTAKFGF